jgi:hypothetical protein
LTFRVLKPNPATHLVHYVAMVWPDGREYHRDVALCASCLAPVTEGWRSIDPNLTVTALAVVEHDEFADTLIDPDALESARKAFPDVVFSAVDWVELDECGGCPEGLMDPLPAQVVITYRHRNGRVVNEPVGGCCLHQELTWHTHQRTHGLNVRVVRDRTRIAEAA